MQMLMHPSMCARCTQLFFFANGTKCKILLHTSLFLTLIHLYFPLLVLYSSACALSEWRSFSFHFSYQFFFFFTHFNFFNFPSNSTSELFRMEMGLT